MRQEKMSEIEKTVKKSTSERLDEIIGKLSKDQLRFIVALQDYPSKKEAAEAIGLKPNTVYNWNGDIDEAIQLMAQERLEGAKAIRKNALIKAIMVKIAGLDSGDEALRQKVATEIIEWELGKALQRQDVTSQGEQIKTSDHEGLNRAVSTLADALGEILRPESDGRQGAVDTAERAPVESATNKRR